MKFTVGKLMWVLSFIIFLIFAYGQSTFLRVYDMFTGGSSGEVFVQKFVPSQEVERTPGMNWSPSAASTDSTIVNESAVLGVEGMSLGAVTVTPIEPTGLNSELHLELELLKYRMQQVEDQYEKLKIEIKENLKEKDDTMDNLMAIMTTLLPILLPYITKKQNNKEITAAMFKKEVKK